VLREGLRPAFHFHIADSQVVYSVRGLERSELGGSHGCPIHSAPSLGQSIVVVVNCGFRLRPRGPIERSDSTHLYTS